MERTIANCMFFAGAFLVYFHFYQEFLAEMQPK